MRACRLDISYDMKLFILQRDNVTCQVCGAVSGEPRQDNSQKETRIQVRRILAKSLGGRNNPGNLRAICSVCIRGPRNLLSTRPSLRALLIQTRRATGGDKLELLRWLICKYPVQAAQINEVVGKQRTEAPRE
jgi:5-methylcytosine-specific restriction endonuclease McrA